MHKEEQIMARQHAGSQNTLVNSGYQTDRKTFTPWGLLERVRVGEERRRTERRKYSENQDLLLRTFLHLETWGERRGHACPRRRKDYVGGNMHIHHAPRQIAT